jgi:arginine deiminase
MQGSSRGGCGDHCGGEIVSHAHGVDSEVGQLRTVLVHRPGLELKRITPRTRDRLLFEALPWVGRAQQEHDVFTQSLRDQGVEVLYVTELLQDALEYQSARDEAIASALSATELGDELTVQVHRRLHSFGPEELAQVLIAGLAPGDLPDGRGLVFQLLDRHDFVIDPLPNLVFTRDSSFWVGDRVAVSSLAEPHRRREADLLEVIYGHHPRFAGIKRLYGPEFEYVAGGDVLLLAPSVLAVGVGQRTTPAGAERLARHALEAGLAHTVLAIPVDQRDGSGYLDTLCTVIDAGTVLMHPAVAFTLTAHVITARPEGTRVSRPQPFLEAAAQAMGIERLQLIDTGLDPGSGQRGQWDDGSNALARPAAGGLPRAQHRDHHPARGSRRARHPGSGQRAGQQPGRSPVHVLPHRPGSGRRGRAGVRRLSGGRASARPAPGDNSPQQRPPSRQPGAGGPAAGAYAAGARAAGARS